ncbi:MAG: hypothetical protein AAGL18_13545, partial [Pseudomonadota bacterium]
MSNTPDTGQTPADDLDATPPAIAMPGGERRRAVPLLKPLRMVPRPLRRPLRRVGQAWTGFSTAFFEVFGANEKRRQFSALSMAAVLNAFLLSVMAVYGTFQIFIPNAPPTTINISLVSQAADPIYPTLRD